MSQTLVKVRSLIARGEVRISAHGYDELMQDDIMAAEVLDGITGAIIIEDYPGYPKGPCALVLQKDRRGNPIHVVWGIPNGKTSPAVLATAYRPDPRRWSADFTRRKK